MTSKALNSSKNSLMSSGKIVFYTPLSDKLAKPHSTNNNRSSRTRWRISPTPPKVGTGGSGEKKNQSYIEIQNVNHFNEIVLSGDNISLINFYAPWCGYCKRLKPHWEEAASYLKNYPVNFVSVDCTVHKELSRKFQIRGFPTIMVLENGKTEFYKGRRTAESLNTFVMSLLD